MSKVRRSATSLAISSLLLCAHAFSQNAAQSLKYDDILPPVTAETLSGKEVDLRNAVVGTPAVMIFSFSRSGGRDAQNWAQHLSKDYPRLSIYIIIFLDSVPRLLRSMVVSRIKSEMPVVLQDRAFVLYHDERTWKQRLQLADESHACVALIRANGAIQWINSESFSVSRYSELTTQLQALK